MEIKIRLFGEFNLLENNNPIRGLNARHQSLIAYLALKQTTILRSEIAYKLWLDSSEEQALTNLRKALHHIKGALNCNLLLAENRTLRFDPSLNINIDLANFKSQFSTAERAHSELDEKTEQAALEAAIAHYSGDFLSGFYDEWVLFERDLLRGQFITGLDRLIYLLESHQHYRDAIRHAQRLLQMDTLSEEAYRTLIRLHALNNDRAAALNVYHSCAEVFSKELEVEPDSSTRELYERLLKSDTQLTKVNAPARPISHPLVARESEWKELLAEWKRSSQGNLHVALLSGEAGIGKTRLAEDLLHWASRQGIHTASAACYSAEGKVSFTPVTGWLQSAPMQGVEDRWIKELGRILPDLQSDTPPAPITESWQKRVFFEAMARALLARNEPVLLLLDDIQWCDKDTLEWLGFFLRFDKQAKLLLLFTLRIEELASNPTLQAFLADLRADGQLTDMELNRLNETQTAELGKHLLGANFSEADLSSLFRQSEGVPLFIIELANTGIKMESIQRVETGLTEKEAGVSRSEMPPRLKAILERHLTRLSSPARAVVESAAVIGREFDFDLLKKVSELDESTTVYALDELWRLRMVRERGGMYDFSHDKLREVTLAGISPIRLRWLHQRTGEALESKVANIESARIAGHFELAGFPTKAAGYYALAATQARQLFAFTEALEQLQNATLLETDPAVLANLHEERGNMLKILDKREDAYQAYTQAHGLSQDALQRARLNRNQSTIKGRFETETAREKYHAALKELSKAQDDPGYWFEWIDLQLSWVEICYWMQDAQALDTLMEQVKQPVERHGTILQKILYRYRMISSALVNEHFFLNQSHVLLARETMLLAIQSGSPFQISNAKRQLGMVELFAGQFDDAENSFREAILLCEKNNDINSMLISRAYLSFTHRRQRKPQDLMIETERLENLLGQVSTNPAYQGLVSANRAWLKWLQGDHEQTRQLAQSVLNTWQSLKNPYMANWLVLMPLLAIAVAEEKTEEALSHAQALLAPLQMRLDPEIESRLLSALETGSTNPSFALSRFREVVAMAKDAGYL